MVMTLLSEHTTSPVATSVAQVVSVPWPPGVPTTRAHTVYEGDPPVVLVGGSWNDATLSVQALLSRTAKVEPWTRSILLWPQRATKITLPPLPSVCGQLLVFAPIRFRLKCGPLGAPFPVAWTRGEAARIARKNAAMAVPRNVRLVIFLKID